MSPPVYLDTNIFVYLKEGFGDVPSRQVDLLAASVKAAEPRLATCEITLAELLPKPYAESHDQLIEQYENWIQPSDWLHAVPADRDVLRAAAILRSSYRSVKLPDAIHLAAAIGIGCERFLTADEGLKGEYRLSVTRYGIPRGSPSVTIIRPDAGTLSQLVSEFSI